MDKSLKALKELGEFLGKKLDLISNSIKDTPQKIQIDMGETSKHIKDLKEDLSSQINTLVTTLSKINTNNFNDMKEASSSLSEALNTLKNELSDKDFVVNVPDISPKLDELKSSILEIGKLITKNKPAGTDKMNTSLASINKTIGQISKQITSIPKTDLQPIINSIEEIKLPEIKKTETLLQNINESIKGINIKIPEIIKLDEMQLRALKPQGGYGGILPARTTKITNVVMPSADTEYSHTFNKSCVSFRMKLRAGNAKFNYSWESGTLAVSGDASSYISIPANWLDSRDGIEYNGKTIFFESSSSAVMEVEEGIA